MRQVLIFLSDADNCFNVVVVCTAPLFTICLIGLLGSGAMSSWARPGVKCVCIDPKPLPNTWRNGTLPPKGTVVDIVGTVPSLTGRSTFNVIIKGHPNFSARWGCEIGWRHERFRPFVPPKTQEEDVALFRQIVAQTPVDA